MVRVMVYESYRLACRRKTRRRQLVLAIGALALLAVAATAIYLAR